MDHNFDPDRNTIVCLAKSRAILSSSIIYCLKDDIFF